MSHECDGRDPTCPGCALRERQHAVLRAGLTAGDALDDITRAQIWARLEPRLAAPPVRAMRWRLPAVAIAAVATIALFVVHGRPPAPRAFVAPADATLSLRLEHLHAALIGPAQLDVLAATPGATAVELRAGTLLAEFEGGQGRSLRIVAPGATIEIVGTLFAVELEAGATCVSVAHGAVRMTTASRVRTITGGQRACSDLRAPGAIDAAMRHALDRHAMAITAELAEPIPAPPGAAVAASRAGIAQAPDAGLPAAVAPAVAAQIATPTRPQVSASPSAAAQSMTAPATARRSVSAPSPTARATASHPAPSPGAVVAQAPLAAPTAGPSAPRHAPRDPQPVSPPVASSRGIEPPRATIAQATSTGVPAAGAAIASSPRVATASPGASAGSPPPRPPAAIASAPAPVALPSAPPTATSLYRAAETALAARDLALADQRLATLLAQFPESALLDQALYERARIAYRRQAWSDAQRQLDRLATIAASPLAEPGGYLACRIAFEAGDGGAEPCLIRYRKRYPRSPHDLDLLGLLTELAFRAGGCSTARPRVEELTRLAASSALARGWQQRCPEVP